VLRRCCTGPDDVLASTAVDISHKLVHVVVGSLLTSGGTVRGVGRILWQQHDVGADHGCDNRRSRQAIKFFAVRKFSLRLSFRKK